LSPWLLISNGQLAPLAGPDVPPAASPYPEPVGNPQGQRAAVPTATITANFNGQKSPGDNLLFPSNSQTCDQSLGLWNCPAKQTWVWNVEVTATVSDDASKWKTRQSFTAQGAGEWEDSEGGLHPGSFSKISVPLDDPCQWPADSRSECNQINVVQQPSGQKAIFWLDSPGRRYYLDPPTDSEPIDSITQVEHFTSMVCNRSNVCTKVYWFFNLVVDPGSSLDIGLSAAGPAGIGP